MVVTKSLAKRRVRRAAHLSHSGIPSQADERAASEFPKIDIVAAFFGGLHAHRVVGSDCHYRDPCRHALTGFGQGQGKGTNGSLRLEYEKLGPGYDHVSE